MDSTRPAPVEQMPTQKEAGPRAITLRAVVLGLLGVVAVAVILPYNDHKLSNTKFTASYFPLGVTLLMLVLILVVNPLLARYRPKAMLRTGELVVIWSLMLIGSAFPGVGLVQTLIPWMVTPTYMLPSNPQWDQVLAHMPEGLFASTDPADDAVVSNFVLGAAPGEDAHVPWGAWLRPCLLWAAFYLPLFGGALCISAVLAPHWIHGEKLQFPLARVMLDLAEQPAEGRCFNTLLGNRWTWAGASVPFVVYLLNGLHHYFPQVPQLPLQYNMDSVFTEGMWQHMMWYMKRGGIYFSMIGIAFFMSAEVSLSLWFFCVLAGVIIAVMRSYGVDPWEAMRSQNYGAILAMGAFLLFLAREHLGSVFRAALGGARPVANDPAGMCGFGLWGALVCSAAAVVWLCFGGMPLWAAVLQIAILYCVWLVLSRIVAETGMFYVLQRMWAWHLFGVPTHGAISAKVQAMVVSTVWPVFYNRETLMGFSFNVLRMGLPFARRTWRLFLAVLAAAMVVSIVVSAVSYLKLYYQDGAVRINSWFAMWWSQHVLDQIHDTGRVPPLPGQSLTQMLIGALVILVLGVCRIHFVRWPLVPIAFCLATSDAMGFMWQSVLVGWLCKVCVMRTGGVALLNRVRPVFMGLVVGELLMAGLWMVVGACVRASGLAIGGYSILPGV